MSDKTIYDLEITEIVNCIHECSRVTESIECKTEFTRRYATETEDEEQAKQPDPRSGSSTPLAGELARAKQTVGNLLQRLIDLDNSICSTVTELEDSTPSNIAERSAAGQSK